MVIVVVVFLKRRWDNAGGYAQELWLFGSLNEFTRYATQTRIRFVGVVLMVKL